MTHTKPLLPLALALLLTACGGPTSAIVPTPAGYQAVRFTANFAANEGGYVVQTPITNRQVFFVADYDNTLARDLGHHATVKIGDRAFEAVRGTLQQGVSTKAWTVTLSDACVMLPQGADVQAEYRIFEESGRLLQVTRAVIRQIDACH